MAQHYYETTYSFEAGCPIPYQYQCGQCGKTVQGEVPFKVSRSYRKTAPRREELALTEAERRREQDTVNHLFRQELELHRKQTEKGHFYGPASILAGKDVCPFCGAKQQWDLGRQPVIELVVGVFGCLVTAALLWLFVVRGGFFAEYGMGLMIAAPCALIIGLYGLIHGGMLLKRAGSLQSQKKSVPIISYPDANQVI